MQEPHFSYVSQIDTPPLVKVQCSLGSITVQVGAAQTPADIKQQAVTRMNQVS